MRIEISQRIIIDMINSQGPAEPLSYDAALTR